MSKFSPLFNDLLNYAMQHTWSHWEIFLFEASHKYLSIASKDFLSAQLSASTADKKYLNGFFLYFSAAGAEEHQDDCSAVVGDPTTGLAVWTIEGEKCWFSLWFFSAAPSGPWGRRVKMGGCAPGAPGPRQEQWRDTSVRSGTEAGQALQVFHDIKSRLNF